MDSIRYWIETEGSGHYFFIAFPVCLLILLILLKGRRVRFLIPSLIISLVIINPWFYKKWDELGLYAYWRILWIVPVIPVLAAAIPSLTERIRNTSLKIIISTTGVVLIIFGGTFLYNGAGGSFVEAANASKLPNDVVKIADHLLKLDEHPSVIVQDPIGVYIRQYTGAIDTLFGRNLGGYITWGASREAYIVNDELNNPESDLMSVSQFMLDDGYDYLIIHERENIRGFELVGSITDYVIYKPVGVPRFAKERNEFGQVTALTTLDSHGHPMNNIYGYSTIHREYDSYNNVTREWYTNTADEAVAQPAGYKMIEQTWGRTILKERTYRDGEGKLINRNEEYSKVVWNSDENGTRYVSFYNADDEEITSSGLNLVKDIRVEPDGWTEWMTPEPGKENCYFTLGSVNLDKHEAGDEYSCQIEIEFKDVKGIDDLPFRFWTQGAVDGRWNIGNVWDGALVWMEAMPEDGIYRFTSTRTIDDGMATASSFELGFRCDNWTSGSFRVRNIKVEKGNRVTEWTPGL